TNPPQKPQPTFADFWYLGIKMQWEQSSVTSCHFFSTTSLLTTLREGPPAFSKKNRRYRPGTSARRDIESLLGRNVGKALVQYNSQVGPVRSHARAAAPN